jgi:hypothetical protein
LFRRGVVLRRRRKERAMYDIAYIGLTLAFFVACALLVRAFERI